MPKETQKKVLSSVQSPPSLRQLAFDAIKEAIMSQSLKRGEVYSEHGLAAQLGMSKTPVHEAILDLESRGFVTLVPRKGIKVNELTEEEIHNLYQFRLVIESAVSRCVAGKLTREELAHIRELHQKCIDATTRDDHLDYIRWDRELHSFLASLTKNNYLVSALENVRDLLDWMGVKAMYRPDRLMEVDREHELVLDMLETGDVEGAEKRMTQHVLATERNALVGWGKK